MATLLTLQASQAETTPITASSDISPPAGVTNPSSGRGKLAGAQDKSQAPLASQHAQVLPQAALHQVGVLHRRFTLHSGFIVEAVEEALKAAWL